MKFELFGGQLVNLDHVSQIRKNDELSKIKKDFDADSQTIQTTVSGTPYQILVNLSDTTVIVLGYKSEQDRDLKFNSLVKGLGAE